MVKGLRDLCLDCLCHRFEIFSRTNLDLPPSVAQELLHRLINHDYLLTDFLPSITYNLLTPRLNYIDIYRSELINDAFLTQLGAACTSLSYIRFVRCPKITDDGLSELFINQTRLEHLELRWLHTIDGRCLTRLHPKNGPNNSPKLRVLNLKGCSNILPENIAICLQHHRTSLTKLNLRAVRLLTGESVRRVATLCASNLLHLNISECTQITDEALYALAENCRNLRRISLMECMNVTEAGLRTLFRFCVGLEKIDMAFCRRWDTPLSLELFCDIPQAVTSLCLSGIQARFTDDHMAENLGKLAHLKHLILNGFGLVYDGCLEKILKIIGANLHTLDLSGNFDKITDDGFVFITQYCTSLKTLGVGLLTNTVTGRTLLPMFSDRDRAMQFEQLLIPNLTNFDPALLHTIAVNCVNLHTVDVSSVQNADDTFMAMLAEHCGPNLRRVFAKAAHGLTDNSICSLSFNAAHLKCLVLSGNSSITDKSILALANHCHELQELYLSGCNMVSGSALRYLQDRCTARVVTYHIMPNAASMQTSVIAKNLDTGEYVRL